MLDKLSPPVLYFNAGGIKTMKNNLTEKLKIAMIKTGKTQTELADLSGQSRGNLANKLIRNDFKLSEYERLVTALGCELEITIVTPNGERI